MFGAWTSEMYLGVEGFKVTNGFMAGDMLMEFGEVSSSESEWNEETSSSSEEGFVVGEDEDFGLPEMVIFLHDPIYQICKEVVRDEQLTPSRCLVKCCSLSSLESLERYTGMSSMQCCGGSVKKLWSDGLTSDGCGDDEAGYGSGIVSFDEKMNVYKKVILVRDVEEVIRRSPEQHASKCTQESNQVGMRKKAVVELLDNEVDQYVAKESFYFDAGYEKGLKHWNCNPSGNVNKLQSLKELMSMTSHVDYATNNSLWPLPSNYSMQESDMGCGQPCNGGRQSFSFPILAKEWFGSPVRIVENTNKFPLQGLLRPSTRNHCTCAVCALINAQMSISHCKVVGLPYYMTSALQFGCDSEYVTSLWRPSSAAAPT